MLIMRNVNKRQSVRLNVKKITGFCKDFFELHQSIKVKNDLDKCLDFFYFFFILDI